MSAPIQTIGGRRFSFGKLVATDASRLHVTLLKVLGEPLARLAALGVKAKGKPEFLSTAHGAAGTEAPTLPDGPPAETPEDGDGGPPMLDVGMGIGLTAEDLAVLGQVIRVLGERMRHEEFIDTLTLVLSSVVCEGRKITDVNVTFGTNVEEMYVVFGHAMKANFESFFRGRLSAFVQLLQKQRAQ